MLVSLHKKLKRGEEESVTVLPSEEIRESGRLICWECKKNKTFKRSTTTECLCHFASATPQQTVHIDYPSTNDMNCHVEWRRVTEREKDKARASTGV